MKNRVVGYRKMLGLTQEDTAKKLNISTTSYLAKEKGYVPFKPVEMEKIKELVLPLFPQITIDDIFFADLQRKTKA